MASAIEPRVLLTTIRFAHSRVRMIPWRRLGTMSYNVQLFGRFVRGEFDAVLSLSAFSSLSFTLGRMSVPGPGRVKMSAEVATGAWTPVFVPAERQTERNRPTGRPCGAVVH